MSTSTQYWDGAPYILTGVKYLADFEVDTKLEEQHDSFWLVGMRWITNIGLCTKNSNGLYYALYANSNTIYTTNAKCSERVKIRWKDNRIYVNDAYLDNFTNPHTIDQAWGGEGMYIFKFRNFKVFSFKIWDTDGELIRDYIPCYRKSDNVPGLYDTVNSVFNTGTNFNSKNGFTVGADVN